MRGPGETTRRACQFPDRSSPSAEALEAAARQWAERKATCTSTPAFTESRILSPQSVTGAIRWHASPFSGYARQDDLAAWQRWIWTLPYDPHPAYGRFKGLIYRSIDPAFESFFPQGVRSLIRLDEIDWGGIVVNGIPPLDYPKHVPAAQASYLGDGDIVFGRWNSHAPSGPMPSAGCSAASRQLSMRRSSRHTWAT